ncbi:hypothetical protein KKD52_01605 [Myxococcota bacterium]|nr:hypothetical protein [Myxococcota bacterium]MBU1509028.1 hypothetical protein [Myxococcota bacterium]
MDSITLTITDEVLWHFFNGDLPEPPENTQWTTALLQLDCTVPEHDSAVLARAYYNRITDPEGHLPPHLRKTKKPSRQFDCVYDFELHHAGTGTTYIAVIPAAHISVLSLRTEAA